MNEPRAIALRDWLAAEAQQLGDGFAEFASAEIIRLSGMPISRSMNIHERDYSDECRELQSRFRAFQTRRFAAVDEVQYAIQMMAAAQLLNDVEKAMQSNEAITRQERWDWPLLYMMRLGLNIAFRQNTLSVTSRGELDGALPPAAENTWQFFREARRVLASRGQSDEKLLYAIISYCHTYDPSCGAVRRTFLETSSEYVRRHPKGAHIAGVLADRQVFLAHSSQPSPQDDRLIQELISKETDTLRKDALLLIGLQLIRDRLERPAPGPDRANRIKRMRETPAMLQSSGAKKLAERLSARVPEIAKDLAR